jgi:hypothetical protein
MVKKIGRSILRRLSKPIFVDNVRKIMIVGSGDVDYISQTIKQLKERYYKAEILLYPHSSYLAELPELPDCKLVEFTAGQGVMGKLKFFWQLRNIKKDMIVSLWTNEPEYNRFKLMAFLLKGKYHVAFNEQGNFFQVSPENLGLLRMHLHMRKGTSAGSISLGRPLRKLVNLILFPIGVVILLLRVCWRLITYSSSKPAARKKSARAY